MTLPAARSGTAHVLCHGRGTQPASLSQHIFRGCPALLLKQLGAGATARPWVVGNQRLNQSFGAAHRTSEHCKHSMPDLLMV